MIEAKKTVRRMTVCYVVDGGLYINLTNKCTNNCDFCIRNNGDGAYGSDSLWLQHEPDIAEVKAALSEYDLAVFREIVFCGYGEPTCRLEFAREVALYLKSIVGAAKIRINTNGQSDLILGCDSAPLFEGAFDSVSISLNASNREEYQRICHSIYGTKSFDAIINFAKNVKNYVQDVAFSVVRQTISEKELEECQRIADDCGIRLRVRELIS